MNCVFCAIVSDRAPRSVVYEDELTMTFMDLRPITPGHLLVVPKQHATYLAEVPEESAAAMMLTAQRCAAALRRSSFRTDGVNLFLADGEAAGQEIFHTHLHVIPRFPGDGFQLHLRYDRAPHRGTLDAHALEVAQLL